MNNFNILWLLAIFGFYAMCGNTLNDVIDTKNSNEKETNRDELGWQAKFFHPDKKLSTSRKNLLKI